jgi:hypothetical protein
LGTYFRRIEAMELNRDDYETEKEIGYPEKKETNNGTLIFIMERLMR